MVDKADGFTFKKELDAGAVLTSVSILVSVGALWFSWARDNALKTQEYADRVRHSTAVVTAKIERWEELSDRYFEDIQPPIVNASEKVAQTHATQPASRILYKGLQEAEARASQRIVEEQLQISYMELYGYVPDLQQVFDETIVSIRKAEAESHEATSVSLQAILRDPAVIALSDTPTIGNKMRNVVTRMRTDLRSKVRSTTGPLRNKMLQLIQLPDASLVDAKRRSAFTKRLATGQ